MQERNIRDKQRERRRAQFVVATGQRFYTQYVPSSDHPRGFGTPGGTWKQLLLLLLFVKRNPHYRALHPLSLWQRISQEGVERNDYSNIMKAVHLTSVNPLVNAACVRGFSTVTSVKSDWRCALGTIPWACWWEWKLRAPEKQADYHPRAAVVRWWLSEQRQRRPNIEHLPVYLPFQVINAKYQF